LAETRPDRRKRSLHGCHVGGIGKRLDRLVGKRRDAFSGRAHEVSLLLLWVDLFNHGTRRKGTTFPPPKGRPSRAVADERRWIGTEPGFDEERYRAGWRRVLDGTWGAAFLAIEDGRLLGYIGIHPHDEYGHVIGMLVDENYRGRGIGKALLDAAEGWARERGLPEISLLVFPHNERALRLYRSAGFEQREYYPSDVTRQTGEVWDTILMVKRLA
jgi:ribosomal protein S18 acetylase RimI-like enzyme